MQGNSARRNHPAKHVENQDEFIARRISISQGSHVHVSRQFGSHQFDDVAVFFLDADNAAPRADEFHTGVHAFDHRVGKLPQYFFIFMQQGFALGGIEQQRIGFSAQFYVRGKARAPGANDSSLGDIFNGNIGHLKLIALQE